MENKKLKVTDKRMFTPDGQLRDEYRFLEEGPAPTVAGPEKAAPEAAAPEKAAPQVTPAAPPPAAQAPRPAGPPPAGSHPGPGTGEEPAPGFLDLIQMLAEPASLYLGDLRLPDGRTQINLELARLHIDLLRVLEEKTRGNLDLEERSILEDVLYSLRMRYIQKQGR